MGRSKNTDTATTLKILLEAYVKIIPCRKVTIETLSKNGNVLSTQKKETFDEPIILNISKQEVISEDVKDFTVIENDSLIANNLFQQYHKVSTKISLKCPYVETPVGKSTKTPDINDIIKDFAEDSNTIMAATKPIDAELDVEVFQNMEGLPTKDNMDDVNQALMAVGNFESTLENSEDTEANKNISDEEDLTQTPDYVSFQPDDSVNPNTNNNANIILIDPKDMAVNPVLQSPGKPDKPKAATPEKSPNESPVRRTSRRYSSQKLALALKVLKPKKSKRNAIQDLDCDKVKQKTNTKKDEEKLTKLGNESPVKADQCSFTTSTEDSLIVSDEIHSSEQINTNSESMTIDEEIELMNNAKLKDAKSPRSDKTSITNANVSGIAHNNSTISKRPVRKTRANSLRIIKTEPTEELITSKKEKQSESDVLVNTDVSNESYMDEDTGPGGDNDMIVLESLSKRGRKRKRKVKLEKEIQSVQGPSPFRTLETTCQICHITVCEGGLTKHMTMHKDILKQDLFECAFCGKTFNNKYAFESHNESHKGQNKDGKFECQVCLKLYANKSALFKHRRSGPCSTEFKCDTCNMSFSSEKSLHFHINQEHAALSNAPWKCSTCGKPFVTQGGLCRHKKLNQCKTDLMCNMCKKRFSKVAYFEKHMLKHKEFVEKTFQCDLCGNFLGSVYSLHKHMSRHKNIKKHLCLQCNKTFFDPSGLKVHMRSHNNERPYICDMCGQSFAQSGHLCRHKLQSHKIGQYPFVCTLCGKGFVDKRNIDGHYKTHEKRNLKAEMKKIKPKKPKVITKSEEYEEPKVVHITTEYDISDLLNAHMTQTNSDGSQTIISTNAQSIEQIIQAANEDPSTIEYISTEEIADNQVHVYDDHQTIINLEDMKVENTDVENIVYTIEENVGAVESIPASDLGILAETAQQFQSNEGITYYIIKK